MDDLLQDFLAETSEMKEEIADTLVAWENAPGDAARLDAIFRFVHTVKGSAGFLTLPRIGALAHAAEDAMDGVRRGRRSADAALVSAVLAIIDRIVALCDAMGQNESQGEPAGDDADLVAALAARTPVAPPAVVPVDVEPAAKGAARIVRVPLGLMDQVMTGMTELVLARNEMGRLVQRGDTCPALAHAFERLSDSIAQTRDRVSRMRMQPMNKLFAGVPRLVRDTAAAVGKTVTVTIEGADVEIDREMIEAIRDPLTHIIRNAVDHGLETPADRRAAGKGDVGHLRIAARQSGNQIHIDIADDGRGIDEARLVEKAMASGALSLDDARALSPQARLALVFRPGLSTAEAVSTLSGRGVGMDVVKANIERIGGMVDLNNRPGSGLSISLRVPLTLTIIPALLIEAGGEVLALPRGTIRELVLQTGGVARVERVGGAAHAIIRGERIPLIALEDVLGIAVVGDVEDRVLIVMRPPGVAPYVLGVAGVVDQEDLVIKPAAPVVMATGIYAGTTLPNSGRSALLLDPLGIPAVAGILSGVTGEAEADDAPVPAAVTALDSLMLFVDWDGAVRGVSLAVVDRIEDVATAGATRGGDAAMLTLGERLVPLHDDLLPAAWPDRLRVLRLSDGTNDLAYPIGQVRDIVRWSGRLDQPARTRGPVAGTALVDGEQVQVIDHYHLFARHAGPAAARGNAQARCHIAARDEHWARLFLAPLVEAAGYSVSLGDASVADADVILSLDGAWSGDGASRPVIALSSAADAARGSIHRYDRAALIAALAQGRAA